DLKILVVDDSKDILSLVNLWLAKTGAKIRTAGSAPEALKVFKEFHPDILLSDIGMPEEDGYSLIEKVRKLPANEGGNVQAAALTAYARDEERLLSLKAGFQMHIPKPISDAKLISAVSELAQAVRAEA
ncbi:MAG: response regulator, partial [Bdellovibrionia bacterium]